MSKSIADMVRRQEQELNSCKEVVRSLSDSLGCAEVILRGIGKAFKEGDNETIERLLKTYQTYGKRQQGTRNG